MVLSLQICLILIREIYSFFVLGVTDDSKMPLRVLQDVMLRNLIMIRGDLIKGSVPRASFISSFKINKQLHAGLLSLTTLKTELVYSILTKTGTNIIMTIIL